jgi:hypothetical protein
VLHESTAAPHQRGHSVVTYDAKELHRVFESQRTNYLFTAVQQRAIASEAQSDVRTLPKGPFECENRQKLRLLFDKTSDSQKVWRVAAGFGGVKTQHIDAARVDVNFLPRCAKPGYLLGHRV